MQNRKIILIKILQTWNRDVRHFKILARKGEVPIKGTKIEKEETKQKERKKERNCV